MRRDKELELVAASLARALSGERAVDGDELRVPTASYTDLARFEGERERLFRLRLNVVTLASRVAAPGDFVTAAVVGAPIIVARGEDGRLRAFLNVCRHRGATVERRVEGRCKRFVCPYHGWTYGNDGQLLRVRHAEGFPSLDKGEHGLVELACAEAAGLVFVCPAPGVEPPRLPAPLVEELEAMVGPRPTVAATTSRTWAANWKLIVEGGIESYHFKVAHTDTIAPYFTDTQSTWERVGDHRRLVIPRQSITELADQPRERWRIRDHTHIVYTLHPNAMILLQRSHFDLILMTPLAPDQTRIDVLTVGAAGEDGEFDDAARGYLAKNHAVSIRTLDEDFEIAEQIQRGLPTGANSHLRFARFEGALSDWRQQLEAELSGG